jgi:hypothetical protein
MEDLDYLQIKILAHRKLVLRAVEDLRQSHSMEDKSMLLRTPSALLRSLSAASSNTMMMTQQQTITAEEGDEESNMVIAVAKENKSANLSQNNNNNNNNNNPSKVHWSQLEPLSAKPPGKPASHNTSAINAADDTSEDVIDEEAERIAFMAAVAEWRRSGTESNTTTTNTNSNSNTTTNRTKVTIVREYERNKGNHSQSQSTAEMAVTADFEIEADKDTNDSSRATGSAWNTGAWVNPFGSAGPPPTSAVSSSSIRPNNNASKLLEGQLDEQQEHQVSDRILFNR